MKNIIIFTAVLLLAFMTSILLVSLKDGRSGEDIRMQMYGTEEQKLYLLLVDHAYIVGQLDFNFRKGFDETQKKIFTNLLQDINYKRDCSQGTSVMAHNSMSCYVNGRRIDYFGHSEN
jgi:hypothetical protein